MSKNELLCQLNTIRNNFYLTLIAGGLFGLKEIYPYIKGIAVKISDKDKTHTFTLSKIEEQFENENFKKTVITEFEKMGLKAFITETFKVIETYCEDTTQHDLFKQQDWYHFAKQIRNALSHNDRFYFKDIKKPNKLFPIKWKNKIITIDMNNQPLTSDFFSYMDAIELHQEMKLFVEKILK